MSGPFAGAATLGRLVVRRDRLRLPLWLVGLGGVIAVSAAAVPVAPVGRQPLRAPLRRQAVSGCVRASERMDRRTSVAMTG